MRKFLSIFIAAALMVGCMAPAFALDASNQHNIVDGQGTSDVVVESAEAVQLTVTVPVQLPMAVSADGSTTVADNAKIVNKSYSPVKVSTYSIESKDGWQLVDETHDFSKDNVGTKNFSFSLSENVYNVIDGRSEQPFTYDGKISGQKAALDNAVIGTVLWNIGWNGETGGTGTGGGTGGTDTPDPGPAPEEPVTYTDFTVTSKNRAAVGYTGAEGENLVIPATFVGDGNNGTTAGVNYKVVKIGSAFKGRTSLTSVVIPDSVTNIGSSAFVDCSSLTDVTYTGTKEQWEAITVSSSSGLSGKTIHCSDGDTAMKTSFTITPDNRAAIGYTGAEGENLIIPSTFVGDGNNGTVAGVNYKVVGIGGSAFKDCTQLTSITIPSSVRTISNLAFQNCTSLTDITYTGTQEQWNTISVEDGSCLSGTVHCSDGDIELIFNFTVTDSNRAAVGYTGAEGENLVIPATFIGDGNTFGVYARVNYKVIEIKGNAFSGCSSLTSVTIPDGVTNIGSSAFHNCFSLASAILPDSITSIERYAFTNTALTSITIPNHVTSIRADTFSGCSSLASVTLPEGITFIGDSAFSGCSSLASVTIPDGVTNIGSSAFDGCSSLTDITYTGTKEQWNSITIGNSGWPCGLEGKTIHCTDGDITA